MITDMVPLTITGPLNSHALILETAWELNCLHLQEVNSIELQPINIPDHILYNYQKHIDILTEFELFFEKYKDQLQINNIPSSTPLEIEQVLDSLHEKIDDWKADMASIEENEQIYRQYDQILSVFDELMPDLDDTGLLEARGIIIRKSQPALQRALHQELSKLTDDLYQLSFKQISSDIILASLIFPKEYSSLVRQLLTGANISELVLPSSISGNTLRDKMTNLKKVQQEMDQRQKDLFASLQEHYNQFLGLQEYYHKIRMEIEKIDGLRHFGQSEFFDILSVYCDVEIVDKVTAAFEKIENVYVQQDPSGHSPPSLVKNPSVIKEFQVFTDLLPPLAPNSFDPTPVMAIFFPFFYGFIVGDIGYGLIISLLGLFVYKKFREDDSSSLGNLGAVFFISGFFSIFFGILFGEFFGSLGGMIGLHPIWFHRGHDLMTLLLISIVIGAFHIVLGLIIGVYNAIKVNHIQARDGRLGMTLFFVGVFIAFYGSSITSSYISYLTGILCIAGLYFLIRGEGFIGIIEIIGTIANMLSYARLMALGAASVILADLANEMYFMVGGGLMGILVAILVHILNIVIAMFSPTIHSMRLHLVEFFNKFVEYGVTAYTPFGPQKQFTRR